MSQLALIVLGLAAISYANEDANSDASARSPRGVITDPVAFSNIKFDYVIVGGGTAGLAVGARLADAGEKVGVIEAGLFRPNDALIDTPNFYGRALGNVSVDWAYFSVPQAAAGARPVFQPRGKILGGSSALNFMAYQRASTADYDGWTQLGNPHWSWSTLLPYFKKAETYTPETPEQRFPGSPPTPSNGGVGQYEGDCGPIKATFNDFYSDLGDQYVKAVNKVGIPTNPTPDYGNATGIFNSPESIDRKTGKRSYATEYYLKDSPRSNFVILTGAQATQVLFKDGNSSKKVVADKVQYVVGGEKYKVTAKKEVILSAGSFQTPQLLELSGIGQSKLLKGLKIPVLVDLPGVGENLQDHIYAPQDYEVKPGHHTYDELRNDPVFAAQALLQYQTQHNGILAAVPAPYAFVSFDDAAAENAKSLKSKLDADLAANPPTTDLQKAQFKIQRKWLDTNIGNVELIFIPGVFSTPKPAPGKSYISIVTTVQHPFSRGSVHINSTSPLVAPVIDPQYLSRDHDLDALRTVFKLGQKIAQTPPFSDLLVGMSAPDPNTIKTDAQLNTYLRGALSPVFHPIGTAAMAPREIGGVVNEELVVYGTKNLRVVDASIIPLHIAAHPQESIYALAEKAADIILSGAA